MNILKKKILIYKNLMSFLIMNQSKTNKNINSFYKNIKFEIKLYLIGLSFNRFIFNFDKMLFVLCIITNFLYFISFQSPRVLFLVNLLKTIHVYIKALQIYAVNCILSVVYCQDPLQISK